MSRSKPEQTVKSKEDVNDVLYKIALAEFELQKIDTEAQVKTTQIQKTAERAGKAYRDKITSLESQLLLYAESQKDDLFPDNGKKAQKRSVSLTFGKIGYRKSTTTQIENEAKTIELIEITKKRLAVKIGINQAIKRDPKIIKNDLKKYDTETLAKFGITRTTDDTFFYETDTDAVNQQLQKAETA